MASLQEIKDKIQAANEIGRANLAAKGVTCAENATTCEIMCRIADCQVGENVSDGTSIKFGSDETEYAEKYAVLSESLNEIARLTGVMAGTNNAMTLEDIIYWLGRVIYIPQARGTTEYVMGDCTSNATAILPDVQRTIGLTEYIFSPTTSITGKLVSSE